MTNMLPIDLVFDATDFYLTTDMFTPVIPEFEGLYGRKNLTSMF